MQKPKTMNKVRMISQTNKTLVKKKPIHQKVGYRERAGAEGGGERRGSSEGRGDGERGGREGRGDGEREGEGGRE